MAQTHKKRGFAYGTCDRCGENFVLRSRGRPYRFCSRKCAIVPPSERFSANIDYSERCWVWNGKKNDDGYGEMQINKKIVKAHRFSFEQAGNKIPNGMEVCHSCDNPACVRPEHLFLGTHSDNMADMARKGRAVCPRLRGERHGAAKLTDEQANHIRVDRRTQRQIAASFGVSQSLVSMIKTGACRSQA